MLAKSFFELWRSVAPAIADHLWQSTLLAAAVALVALVLRKHSAQLRYALWLAASLKFLVPFSLLVTLGSQFSWRHVPIVPSAGTYAVEFVSQPFTQPVPLTHAAVSVPTAYSQFEHWGLLLLLGLWGIGSAIVVLIWIRRWRRIASSIRDSVPLTEGREWSGLRRSQALVGWPSAMPILLSPTSVEPGVFGIFRSVLLWPHSLSEHLDDAHLEAVIAHELCHVRRRDNLAAAVHMLVEAIFWFHPLVWWIGAQLIAERERACDEGVIELGGGRHTYAESILKVCEFCLSSPLTCVSGVTGADLKKRMVHIMTDRVVRKLNFARKFLLWTAVCLAVALPIGFGLLNVTPSRADAQTASAAKFSSVSIKPHLSDANNRIIMGKMITSAKGGNPPGFAGVGVLPHMLVKDAYRVQDGQITGEPDWMKSQRYDVAAQIDPQTAEQMKKLSEDQVDIMNQQMMRQLLADYFKLTLHQDSVNLPVYELVVGEGGPQLERTTSPGLTQFGPGQLNSKGAPMSIITEQLSRNLGRPVVDKTGLQGTYAFRLHWTPDAEEMARLHALGLPEMNRPAASTSGPDLMTAVQEQLGLKLRPQTTRLPLLVIDHIEQPIQN